MSRRKRERKSLARAAAGGGPADSGREPGRFSARRKTETILRLLRGESLDSLARELGVTGATLAQWREAFLAGGCGIGAAGVPGAGSWGSWGGRRPSLADYVTVAGLTDGRPPPEGVHVDYALRRDVMGRHFRPVVSD